MIEDVFIIDGIRTPIGKFGGSLASIRADDLAAHVLRALIARNPHLPSEAIDDVIMGCANQAGEDNRNVARMALLLAGIPDSVPGETVNRLCASGLSAIVHAARAIQVGDGSVYLAGGVEHMTRAPYVLSKSCRAFGRDAEVFDTSIGWRFVNPALHDRFGTDSMGETAENVAARFRVSREDQDQFACWSQQKTADALVSGRFDEEIEPVLIPQRKGEPLKFCTDEFPRPHSTIEALSALAPAFKTDGTVTAGNASGINDGSVVLLLAGPSAVNAYSLRPRARFVASSVVGVEPRFMGIGPVQASRNVLQRAGLSLDDMAVIELNEAFAAQSLACLRELGIEDKDARVNPNGGAIALGHPLGMTGGRLVLTALRQLERIKGQYALCSLCVGVGQGMACIIERIQ